MNTEEKKPLPKRVLGFIGDWGLTLMLCAVSALVLYSHYSAPQPANVQTYTDQYLYNLPVGLAITLPMLGFMADTIRKMVL
jgi:hypothetical protein